MSPTVAKLLSGALGAACLGLAFLTRAEATIMVPLVFAGGGLLGYPIRAPGAGQ